MVLSLFRSFLFRGYSMYRINETIIPSSDNVFRLSENFKDCVCTAVKHIKNGNVIAIPTDTIYGLAADAQNIEAVQKLYMIKGRVFSKPLAICVCTVVDIEKWGRVDHLPQNMLTELLPGPVTVILNRTLNLNSSLNPGMEKVAIRIPENRFVQQLTSSLDSPLALTSANKSNEMSSISIEEFSSLWNQLDAIFDGGRIGDARSGSTIIDLSEPGKYDVVRKGCCLDETLKVLRNFDVSEK